MGGKVPLGYDPDGRTLKVNETEAQTIRRLYDLYEELGTVRQVKEEADRLGLRSRTRAAADGTLSGGGAFDRGHIHHILTNPIYAGRIRHRRQVYDGQHPAIIDPDRWDAIQQRLQDGAARSRRKASAGRTSLLCGKLFDETGDRLTPSHSKTKTGTRLRYYISHRLVARSGEAHPGAWRLPADDLETRIADLVRTTISRNGFIASVMQGESADAIARASAAAAAWLADARPEDLLALVARVDIAPGSMTLKMDAVILAERIAIDAECINADALTSRHPFQLRKRGVETRIVMADTPAGQDETLIRNIARAHAWFGGSRPARPSQRSPKRKAPPNAASSR
jgi:site-specific DNA recombinase